MTTTILVLLAVHLVGAFVTAVTTGLIEFELEGEWGVLILLLICAFLWPVVLPASAGGLVASTIERRRVRREQERRKAEIQAAEASRRARP